MNKSISGKRGGTDWRRGVLFLTVAAVALAVLAFAALSQRANVARPITDPVQGAALSVDVVEAVYQDMFIIDEAYSGLARARRESALGFETGGRLAMISADVGSQVKQGQTLAVLDTRSLAAQREAARAGVREAEASLALAEATVERQKILSDKGHVSRQRYDEAVAVADTARARIGAAASQVDTLDVQISLARIIAPFDGVVTARHYDEGAIAAPGMPVLVLVEAGVVEAQLGLPQDIADSLDPEKVYALRYDGGVAEAQLRAITGVVDTQARTVSVVFDIVGGDIPPAGTLIRLDVPRGLPERGFWAPITALSEAQRGLWAVYVAHPDASGAYTTQTRLVEIVHAESDRAYVRGALEPGEKVIVDGLHRLTPGQSVLPVSLDQR
jgi:membrane fusion protein, multidrug efflux system